MLNQSEETGDTVNDAVYRRNRAVEDLYNFKFEYTVRDGHLSGSGYNAWLSLLTSSIMADDGSIQLAGGYTYRLAMHSLDDAFLDFNEMSHVDFSNPWWPSNIQEACNVGGNLKLVIGNIEPDYYNRTFAMYFNKKLAEDLSLPNLYELVKSGDWTIDKCFELAELAGGDLNGDGKLDDDNDSFGLINANWSSVDVWTTSCDVKTVELEGGVPKLTGLTEHYVDLFEKLNAFIHDSGKVTQTGGTKVFTDGRALFLTGLMSQASTLRQMDDDFGILPMPKWDSSAEYRTHNDLGDATGYVVPSTTDAEMAGVILEAMAYLGYSDVLPEYYDRALVGKVTRDNESGEMLDIIFNNVVYSFTQFYAFAFGDQQSPMMMLRMAVLEDKPLASTFEKYAAQNQAKLDELLAKIAE